MRPQGILGKDSKTKDEKPLGGWIRMWKENTTELDLDPLEVQKKLSALEEKRKYIASELDTQIKVSNALRLLRLSKRYARITKTLNPASRNRVALQKLVKGEKMLITSPI